MEQLSPNQELFELLHQYRQTPLESRPRLRQQLEQRYGAERSILIGDMAGFTRRASQEGIVHYLSLIGAMRTICAPIIAGGGGYLFKAEADNVFAAFFTPEQALQAARAIQRGVREVNAACPECDRLELGLGLARGQVLAIGTVDVWGNVVNIASKLGEDLAEASEILAHDSMEPTLRREGSPLEPIEVVVSQQPFRYFRVTW